MATMTTETEIKQFLNSINEDLQSTDEELTLLNDIHYHYGDDRVQSLLETINSLKYIKHLVNIGDIDAVGTHIQDYNDYNVFKARYSTNSTNTTHKHTRYIATDAQIDEITNGKEMYITTKQLKERFNISSKTIGELRILPYSDENHLEHYKLNPKVIVYKYSYVVQYIEKYNKRFTQ